MPQSCQVLNRESRDCLVFYFEYCVCSWVLVLNLNMVTAVTQVTLDEECVAGHLYKFSNFSDQMHQSHSHSFR